MLENFININLLSTKLGFKPHNVSLFIAKQVRKCCFLVKFNVKRFRHISHNKSDAKYVEVRKLKTFWDTKMVNFIRIFQPRTHEISDKSKLARINPVVGYQIKNRINSIRTNLASDKSRDSCIWLLGVTFEIYFYAFL